MSDPVPYLPSPWPPKEGICKEDLSIGLVNLLHPLGPGRPSAGGPRMDRRAVTSSGVVKISRLA